VVGWFNPTSIAAVWSSIGVVTKTPSFAPRKLGECSFLSHSWAKVGSYQLPVPERDKVICSLLWGGDSLDPRWVLLRAYALRNESWVDVECRDDIMSLIAYVRAHYGPQLVGTVPDTTVTMEQINSIFKTDPELWRLYALPDVLHSSDTESAEPNKNWLAASMLGNVERSVGNYEQGSVDIKTRKGRKKQTATLAPSENWVDKAETWVSKEGSSALAKAEQVGSELLGAMEKYGGKAADNIAKNSAHILEAGLIAQGLLLEEKAKAKRKPKTMHPKILSKKEIDKIMMKIPSGWRNDYKTVAPMAKPKIFDYSASQGTTSKVGKAQVIKNLEQKRPNTNSRLVGVELNPGPGRGGGRGGKQQQKRGKKPKKANKQGFSQQKSAPAAFGSTFRNRALKKQRITHMEQLTSVPGSVSFSNNYYALNPGLVETFPWMAQIARSFEEYKVVGLKFVYVPSCGSSTKGNLMMSYDYNAVDELYADAKEMGSSDGCTTSNVWEPKTAAIDVKCANNSQAHFVRSADQPDGTDLKTFDVGIFEYATMGCADTTAIGLLYIEYTIDLIKPKQASVGASFLVYNLGGSITSTKPFGDVWFVDPKTTLPVVVAATTTITLPFAGWYSCFYGVIGTTFSGSGNATAGTGTTIINTTPLDTELGGINAGADKSGLGFLLHASIEDAVFTMQPFTSAASATKSYMIINQIPTFASVADLFTKKESLTELRVKQRRRARGQDEKVEEKTEIKEDTKSCEDEKKLKVFAFDANAFEATDDSVLVTPSARVDLKPRSSSVGRLDRKSNSSVK